MVVGGRRVGYRKSERRFAVQRDVELSGIGGGGAVGAHRALDVSMVLFPELVADEVQQFEDGERLLGRPVIWQDRWGSAFHGFFWRRLWLRCSLRSCASRTR